MRAAYTQTRPQGQESVWAVLALLRHLPLESLACSVYDGEGLSLLAHSAPSLAPSLRSLTICSVSGLRRSSGVAAAPLSSSDLDFLGALTGLKSLLLFWTVAPASLSRLTALTRLHLHVCNLSPALVADRLAPLRGLRQLIFARWETPPTTLHALPACGSVTQLQCSLWHTGAATLAAAFPGVLEAKLSLLSEESAPVAPPPQPGAPRWSSVRSVAIRQYRHAPSCLQMLQALGALGGALRSLSITEYTHRTVDWRPELPELLAILAAAPSLERLSLDTAVAMSAALSRPRLHACLKRLSLSSHHDYNGTSHGALTTAGLLDLGAAFPALEELRLIDEWEEDRLGRQLDALGAAGDTASAERRREFPETDDGYLVRAIRRAQGRLAAAAAAAAAPAVSAHGGGDGMGGIASIDLGAVSGGE